jgi:hypothetical protein
MLHNKIKIDFVPGSHGNFLERVITKFLLRDSEFDNYDWFTENGSSHGAWHSDFANRLVQAWHWSDKKVLYAPNDTVIRISVKRPYYGIVLINHLYRTVDSHLTIGNLDRDTATQLSHCEQGQLILNSLITDYGDKAEYSVDELSGLFEHKLFNHRHCWQDCNNVVYTFEFASFFNLDDFCAELDRIACLLQVRFMPDSKFYTLYSNFLDSNQGWHSWCRIQENQPDLDWFEQLWKSLLESSQLD